MCGINGIFAYRDDAPPVDADELTRSRDHMIKRGPDGAGLWIDDGRRVGFGHRRLAIIDLSPSGAQPMHSADGRYVMTFNGEIYNYRALRTALEQRGIVFTSQSDSEVILQLYATKGAELVHDLRGMFSIAIWDHEKRELFLARDPFGIKPLYYADDGRTLRFASQVKALVAGGAVSTELEPAGMTGFYLWGSVPEPWTYLRGVMSLPAGCSMLVDQNGPRTPRRFHSVPERYLAAERSNAPVSEEEVAAALLESVNLHLVADVPVGCFLSAGIDSGAMLGLMRDAGASVSAITLGFAEYAGSRDDETGLAAEVARQYGMAHHARFVTQAEFLDDLPKILDAMDQPSIDGVNSWFVSKAVHEIGLKVAISGTGGDELFGGYPAFRDLPNWTRKLAPLRRFPFAGPLARQALTGMGGFGINPKAAGMLEYGSDYHGAYLLRRGLFMPWELDAVLDRDFAKLGVERLGPHFGSASALDPMPSSDFGKVAALESVLYMRNQLLRDIDWASMAHSLEVRVPLVDPALLDRVTPAHAGRDARPGKGVLARAPSMPLPAAIADRRKTGFSTPVGDWIEGVIAGEKAPALVKSPSAPWARRWAFHVAGHQQWAPPAPKGF